MRFASLAAACAAGGLLAVGAVVWTIRTTGPGDGDPSAVQVLPDLLTQIYRAYAFEDEAAIYDALSQAVTPDLATELYLQRRRVQVADHAEDGQTQILSVEVYDVAALPQPDAWQVAWRVVGRVSHATHIHERINLYAADLTLTQAPNGWRLARFDLTQSARDTDQGFEGGE